jgi:CheY-like chemotaxis protein
MNGLELAAKLRARSEPRPPRILALSASVIGFTREDALAAGCDDFLGKPFALDDLLNSIARLLFLTWLRQAPPPVAQPGNHAETPASQSTASSPPPDATHTLIERLTHAARQGDLATVRTCLAEARDARLLPEATLDQLDSLAASYQISALRAALR